MLEVNLEGIECPLASSAGASIFNVFLVLQTEENVTSQSDVKHHTKMKFFNLRVFVLLSGFCTPPPRVEEVIKFYYKRLPTRHQASWGNKSK